VIGFRVHSSGSTMSRHFTDTAATTRCEQALARACSSLAGGDSSSMRVLPYQLPLVADRGKGARVWDVDGNEFIDLNMAYGPLIFGHCPSLVIQAVWEQISTKGSQLGFPTEISMHVAEKIKKLYPGMELLRFANSGTEAIASAVRLARAHTGRDKLLLFEGHYHGWSEAVFNKYHAPLELLPSEGFGPAIPGTSGMCGGLRDVLVARWNDIDTLERCMARHGDSIAAVLMEPIMGNAGVIAPQEGYLQAVREMTLDHDCLLIFDEVITGLRVAAGGAQEHYALTPDITVISKALGGGYPVAAFGASRELMELIVRGELFHGGVYSGNAVVMAAAEAVLDEILASGGRIYPYLHDLTNDFAAAIREMMTRLGVSHQVHNVGPMLSLFLTHDDVGDLTNYRDVRRHCDFEKYIDFQHSLQQAGVFFHPNQFEPMFLSTAHTKSDLAEVLERMEQRARLCLLK
jgi:glutamate-1-semialdehyde 2,1-aminomutase